MCLCSFLPLPVLLALVVAATSNPAMSPAGDAAPHHHGSRRHQGNALRRAADALARREIDYPVSDAPATSLAPVPSPPVETSPGATTPTSPVADPTSQPTSMLDSVSLSTPLGPPTSPAPATPTTTATEFSVSGLPRYLVTSIVPGATPTGGSQQPGTEDMGPTTDRSVAGNPEIYVYEGSQKRFHGTMTWYDAGWGKGSCGPVTDEGLTVALDGSIMHGGGNNPTPPMCGRYIMISGPAGQTRAQVMDMCDDPRACPGTFFVDGSHASFRAVVGDLGIGAAPVTWWWAP